MFHPSAPYPTQTVRRRDGVAGKLACGGALLDHRMPIPVHRGPIHPRHLILRHRIQIPTPPTARGLGPDPEGGEEDLVDAVGAAAEAAVEVATDAVTPDVVEEVEVVTAADEEDEEGQDLLVAAVTAATVAAAAVAAVAAVVEAAAAAGVGVGARGIVATTEMEGVSGSGGHLSLVQQTVRLRC